jgi:hypothetical protein
MQFSEMRLPAGDRRGSRGLDAYIMMAKSDVMVRTQIQLEETQYRQLRSLGTRSGKGLAEQVREAVGLYLTQQGSKVEPLASVLGRFRPVDGKALKPHDRDYVDTLR